jgi:chromosome segregation ATPase
LEARVENFARQNNTLYVRVDSLEKDNSDLKRQLEVPKQASDEYKETLDEYLKLIPELRTTLSEKEDEFRKALNAKELECQAQKRELSNLKIENALFASKSSKLEQELKDTKNTLDLVINDKLQDLRTEVK